MPEHDPSTFTVLPNPYGALDARGRPAAAFPLEGLSGRDRYLGADVDHARSQKIGARVFVPTGFVRTKETSEDDLLKAWTKVAPVEVPATSYYRRALQRGDLLPADEATARLARLPEKTPVGPAAMSAARDHAAAEFVARHPDRTPAIGAPKSSPEKAPEKASQETKP